MHTIKYLLLLSISLACTMGAVAQGNLQFSRVILVSNTLQTVPSGKIWKIASIAIDANGSLSQHYGGVHITGSGACANVDVSNAYFEINGSEKVCAGLSNSAGDGATPAASCFPFWLPEFTTLKTLCPGAMLSVVEFNITQ